MPPKRKASTKTKAKKPKKPKTSKKKVETKGVNEKKEPWDFPPRCCVPVPVKEKKAPEGFSPDVALLVKAHRYKWMNGQPVYYHFLARPDGVSASKWLDDDRNITVIREAFEEWNREIGIRFEETDDEGKAQIRIGLLEGNGCWSFLGRQAVEEQTDPKGYNRTMNFGWNIGWWDPVTREGDPRTRGVALHEIGHTLDFPHEHQNPEAHFVWNTAATIRDFTQSQGWSIQNVRTQVLNPVQNPDEASPFDDKSIMGYDIKPGLIKSPEKYHLEGLRPGSVLSTNDLKWAKKWYPPLVESKEKTLMLEENRLLSIPNDTQSTEVTFQPSADANYGIQIVSTADVFFILQDGKEVLKGKDTEGGEKRPKLFYDLKRNKKYTIRVRVNGLKTGDKENAVYLTAYKSSAQEK